METSSLDFSQSDVLEVAVVVTDHHLNVCDSLHVVIHHPINILMLKSSNWCKQRFCSPKYGGNGLFDECHYSETSLADATHKLLQFFEYYCTNDIAASSKRPPPSERSFFDRTRGTNGVILSPYDAHTGYRIQPSSYRKKQALLAGSTVYFDRRIIEKHFPLLQKYLSHKNIDVTTLLETAKRFRPELMQRKPKPLMKHRAMDDIMDSIALYRYLISFM